MHMQLIDMESEDEGAGMFAVRICSCTSGMVRYLRWWVCKLDAHRDMRIEWVWRIRLPGPIRQNPICVFSRVSKWGRAPAYGKMGACFARPHKACCIMIGIIKKKRERVLMVWLGRIVDGGKVLNVLMVCY